MSDIIDPAPSDLLAIHTHCRLSTARGCRRALAESVLRNSGDAIEQMRLAELIPLGRALSAFVESVQGSWLLDSEKIETHLRAARYHDASVASIAQVLLLSVLPTSPLRYQRPRHELTLVV